MRIKEIRKWIEEGGSLPEDLTQEEHRHLSRLGWRKMVMEYDNGQKEFEWHYLHEEWHGEWKKWYRDGDLLVDQEYFYGNRVK